MQQQHPELEEKYDVARSFNGDGKVRSRRDLHVVDGVVADGHDIDGAALERDPQYDVTAAITASVEHRADIEQAKGMLMLVHGLRDPEAAFELLKWRSQETNTK